MLIYLAAPYSHPEPEVRAARVKEATRVAAFLMTKGNTVFSPITHGHAVAEFFPAGLALDHEFWMRQCRPMLELADALLILPLEGWHRSRGVMAERAWAEELQLPEFFWSITAYLPTLTDYRGLAHNDEHLILRDNHD